MKHLPFLLGGLHAFFVAIVFGSAICNPMRAGLLPMFVFVADFPISLLIEWLGSWMQASRLLFEAIAYLIAGSLWFYFLGYLLLKLRGTREV
jgi:hypothetical protein